MRDLVANQLKQRTAVAAAKRRTIHIGRTRFGGLRKLYLVYLDGQPYVVDETNLSSLRRGESLDDLELQPCENEDNPFAGYP